MSHTIAAVSTGSAISAIGIIRLSGDGCIDIAGKVFTLNSGAPLAFAPEKKLCLGSLRDKSGRVIDACCAVVSRGPHSYTGEDTVEFCHPRRIHQAGLLKRKAGADPGGGRH